MHTRSPIPPFRVARIPFSTCRPFLPLKRERKTKSDMSAVLAAVDANNTIQVAGSRFPGVNGALNLDFTGIYVVLQILALLFESCGVSNLHITNSPMSIYNMAMAM